MSAGVVSVPTPAFLIANRGNPILNAQHILHGYTQFNAGNYEEAMLTFQLTEVEPLQILSLFPDVLPGGLGQPPPPGAYSPFAALPTLAHTAHPITPQKVQGEDRLFRALSALIPYLAHIQNRLRLTLEENGFGRNKGELDVNSGGTGAIRRTNSRTQQSSSKAPSSSLSSVGGVVGAPDSNLALAILVDTVLLKAYLLCDIPLLPFLSSPYNLCDIDECANILRAYEKFRARHGQALELLSNLGQMSVSKKVNPTPPAAAGGNASTPLVGSAALQGLNGTEASVKYLQELAVNIQQPCASWPGIPETSLPSGAGSSNSNSSSNASHTIASSHSHESEYSPTMVLDPHPDRIIALILHFSKWILASDVDDGLRIFTFCHTMNMRPVETKRKGGDTNGMSNGGHPSSSTHSTLNIIHSTAYHAHSCIPSSIVLDHLKSTGDREACIAFLESLIQNLGEQEEMFHNELVFLYLESIQKLLKAKDQRESTLRTMQAANGAIATNQSSLPIETIESVAEIPVRSRQPSMIRQRGTSMATDTNNTTTNTLVPSASFNNNNVANNLNNSFSSSAAATAASSSGSSFRDASRLLILRRKLLDFLRNSTYYAAEKMLSKFPRHALLEERAILLARINQHTQALTIYAHALHDTLQAEAYAEEYYLRAQQAAAAAATTESNTASTGVGSAIAQGKDMYLTLLQVYLKPPSHDLSSPTSSSTSSQSLSGSSLGVASGVGTGTGTGSVSDGPMLDEALSLLVKHHARIPSVAALESLPSETPLQALWPYFEKLLCHTTHTLRDEQITKQLLKSEYYAVKEEHLLASRGRVVCDNNTNCSKCNKKLGNSAFARYPNGQIVHYVCHQLSLQGQQAQNTGLKGDL